MALSTANIRDITRDILYGTGLGEKPSLVQGTGTAAVTGSTAVFSVVAGKGETLRAGDILSVYGAASAAAAYSFYVLSISTDALTCVNGYEGAAIADAGSTDLIFEVMPLAGEERIFKAMDTIISEFLWPEVYEVGTSSLTPDLTSGQGALDARDEEIIHAWQKIGTVVYPVSFRLDKNMDATLFSSGRMGSFDFIDASSLYYAAKQRIDTTNSTESAKLNHLVATGAAALALGATQVETQLDSAKKDAQDRGQRDIVATIWRDFLTQKQAYAEDLSRDVVDNFVIER